MNKMLAITGGALIVLLTLSSQLQAAEAPKNEKKLTDLGLYLTAAEANSMIEKSGANIVFIDVRTPAEVAFVGMSTIVDANIPYMLSDFSEWDDKKGTYKMVPNSGFLSHAEALIKAKSLGKDGPIILMCRSGSRSAKAANLLAKAGYSQVYSVVDGFEGDKAKDGDKKGWRVVNGWKNSDLPWSYKISKEKAYLEM